MQRILVLRGGAVGDLIVTLPALGALRQAFPHAAITLVGHPQRAILARHPACVDRIIDLERWDLYRLLSQPPTVSAAMATCLSHVDLLLSYFPTADETLTINLRRYCRGDVLTWPPHPAPGAHVTDHLLRPVQRFVRQPCDACPRVSPDLEARQLAAAFWHSAGLPEQGVVAFHPGSGGAYKLWPLAGWQQVMAWSARQGLQGLLISGPAEHTQLASGRHTPPLPPWPRADQLPLPCLAAVLARCQVVIGHDSGITHLAAAVGATTLALFGPTDPLAWGPRSPRACVLWPDPAGPLTLTALEPTVVIQTLDALLQGTLAFTPSAADCTVLRPAAP